MTTVATTPNPRSAVRRAWTPMAVIDHAEGIYLYAKDGTRYLDGAAGSSVCVNIGHGVKSVRDAMYAQAEKVSYPATHVFATDVHLALAERIASLAPGNLRNNCRVWLTCTGTDSVDAAIRLARLYHVAKGNRSKTIVISRWQGFHGNNLGVTGIHGSTPRRRVYTGMNINSPHIPPAYCYRCPLEKTYPSCNLKCARMLETEIRQQGEENVAAFIAEPVVGSALGAVPAPDGYFQVIREICDKYNVLFIADEVMTAWGRLGYWFGSEHFGVTPDIIATSKGMTSGYTTLAATIGREDIWAPVEAVGVPFLAGHTMDLNPVACAGVMAVLDYLDQQDLLANSRETGRYLREQLAAIDSPIIGDVRGEGMMNGLEIVKDRATREPFDPKLRVAASLQAEALNQGLILFACTGCIDGVAGDMMLVTPPLTITREQVDELVDKLRAALKVVEAAL